MTNKRKIARRKCFVPVEAKSGTVFAEAQTFDISKGGMGFVGRSSIPLHKRIAVEIQMGPEKDPVVAIGRVCWVKQEKAKLYRFGLKFFKFL